MTSNHRTGGKVHLWAPGFGGFGGGITAFSRELAQALASRDCDLRLFGKLDVSGTWDGHPLLGADSFPARLQTPTFGLHTLLHALWRRPDWIVSSHLNFGPIAHWAKRIGGCRYALVGHGVDVNADLSPSRLAALRAADLVIVVSAWTRERMIALGGIDPNKIQILPNTYDERRFSVVERPAELVARYGLTPGEKVILTVARLDPGEGYKGYDRVLQALPKICEACGPVRYLIGGKGGDCDRLERIARELGVADRVTFAGFVPDEELADHYRLADVFAMPSTGEGFGIVFLEAMGCGTPVLGGDLDGSVDALDNGRLGLLVDPTSVDDIGVGLISLLRKEGPGMWFDRKQLSAAVHEKYGREAFRKRVAEIFPAS